MREKWRLLVFRRQLAKRYLPQRSTTPTMISMPPSPPVPTVFRDDLARWVEDNVDALVRAFTSEDDGVVVAADEGDVVDDGDGGVAEGGDSVGEDDDDAGYASKGDVASDISG